MYYFLNLNKKQMKRIINKTIEYIKEAYNTKYEVLNFTKSNTFDPGMGFAIIKKNLKLEL